MQRALTAFAPHAHAKLSTVVALAVAAAVAQGCNMSTERTSIGTAAETVSSSSDTASPLADSTNKVDNVAPDTSTKDL